MWCSSCPLLLKIHLSVAYWTVTSPCWVSIETTTTKRQIKFISTFFTSIISRTQSNLTRVSSCIILLYTLNFSQKRIYIFMHLILSQVNFTYNLDSHNCIIILDCLQYLHSHINRIFHYNENTCLTDWITCMYTYWRPQHNEKLC